MLNWTPPDHWLRITTIDAHTAGEPLRIITSGFPDLPGDTILQKRQYARDHYDHLRRALMWEPRGHADMYGAILTPPTTPEGDAGVMFMHNEGYSTMCGHGIIALVKVGIETGHFATDGNNPEQVIRIDTPAGRVTATAHLHNGMVERVSFINVPAFLLAADQTVEVPGLGTITYDLAFGGAFYAYVNIEQTDIDITPQNYTRLIDYGMRIKRRIMETHSIEHPDGDPDLNFLYGTIFVHMTPEVDGLHSRNVCIFADGEVDRCPTGTGVSGRLAIHYAKGELARNELIHIESIIGTAFTGRIVDETLVGGVPAIIPEVAGTAHIIGRGEFFVDPDDPLADGFILR